MARKKDVNEKVHHIINNAASLRNNEVKYSIIFNHSPVPMALVDYESLTFLDVNNAFEKLFGYSSQECIGKTSLELKLYEDVSFREDVIKQFRTEGLIDKLEFQIRRKDGALRTIVVSNETIEVEGSKYILSIIEDVTERKLAERALLESEAKLKEAQSLAHIGNWDLDFLSNSLYWSDEVYRIFGLEPQEFSATYEAFLEMVHPDDRQAVNNAYTESSQKGFDSYEIEHRIIRRKTNEIRYVHEKCRHYFDKSGKIIRSIGMVQDVTDKQKDREALLINEELFSTAFNSSPNPLAISHIEDGTILKVNEAFVEISGYSYKDIIGNTAINLNMYFHKEDREKALNILHRDGVVRELELRLRRKNGEIRTVLLSMDLLKLNNAKSILTTLQDITERKRIEMQLRDKENKLVEAHQLANLGTYTIDVKSNSIEWSEEMYNIFETPKIKEKLTMDEAFSFIHSSDVKILRNIYETIILHKREAEYEFRIRTGTEKIKHIFAYGKPVLGNDNQVEKIFGTLMDITVRKLAQLKLEETLSELKRSNKDLEHFAYTASHDLQEPIRMIKSYANLIGIKNNVIDEETKVFLDFISEGASRMQRLVDDLLSYSRVTTSKVVFEKVDCNVIVNDALKDLKLRIEEESAVIHIDNLPVVMGNSTHLRQLFQNFLNNALKFRSERTPEIKIGCEMKNGSWLFHIADNGIGIEPEYHNRIFVIFQRLHDREKYPGTGIGLALCKKILERHGGQVCVESEPGRGTIFYFTLPVMEE